MSVSTENSLLDVRRLATRAGSRSLLASLAVVALGIAFTLISTSRLLAEARIVAPEQEQGETFAAIHDRAAAALLAGRLDEALAGFDRALAINTRSARAYYNRGSVYYAKRQYEQAIADFSQAINIEPAFAYAHMNRGIAFSNLERLDDALVDLNEAVRLDATGSDGLFNRAIVHVRRGETARALNDYEAAITRDARDTDAVAARDRLQKLLDAQARLRPDDVVDTSRIAAEIEHARFVEHVLRLVANSCLSHGSSETGLAETAKKERWKAASATALAQASVPTARMIGGWTFSDRFGAYAVMQSIGTDDRGLMVCSLTTQVASAHIMEDVKTGFESRLKTQPRGSIERPGQITTQYRLSDTPAAEVASALVYGTAASALTIRFTFKPRAGAQP